MRTEAPREESGRPSPKESRFTGSNHPRGAQTGLYTVKGVRGIGFEKEKNNRTNGVGGK